MSDVSKESPVGKKLLRELVVEWLIPSTTAFPAAPSASPGRHRLLDFHPNSRGLGVHRIRPFEHLMGFYSG